MDVDKEEASNSGGAADYEEGPSDADDEQMKQEEQPVKVILRSSVNDSTLCLETNRGLSKTLLRPGTAKKGFYDVTIFGAPPAGVSSSQLAGIPAHKWVLSSVSEHLLELFASNEYADSNKTEYTFENIQHDTVKDLIDFIYADKLVFNASDFSSRMQNFIIATKYLVMSDIADACEKFFCAKPQLRVDNYVAMWRFSRKYSCFVLMEASSIGIANNLPAVMQQDEFLDLAFDDIIKLLLCEPVIIADNDERCRAAISWLNFNAESRAVHAADVLNTVPAEVGLIARDTIVALCTNDVIGAECPKLVHHLLVNTVKRVEPDSSRLIAPEKRLSGFMQRDASNVIGGDEAKRQFVQYDILRRCWEVRPELPWARQCVGACMLRDRIVVAGGLRDGKWSACIDEYRFATSTWTRNVNEKLRHRRSTILTCSDGVSNAYFFGGWGDSTCSSVECYDVDGRSKKTTLLANMGFRSLSGAAVFDGTHYGVFVVGGIDCTIRPEKYNQLNAIHHYDTFGDKWALVGFTNDARTGFAAVLMGEDLYIMGGVLDGNKVCDVIEVFNTRKGGQAGSAPGLTTTRFASRAVALDQNVVCVLGGMNAHDDFNSVDVYDKREGKWTTGQIVPDMPNKCCGFGLAANSV